MADVPTLHVAGALAEALGPRALGGIAPAALAAFLAARRWFGLKGRELDEARLAAVVDLRPAIPAVVTQLEVAAGGTRARYQVPLAVLAAPPPGAPEPAAVLARVEARGAAGLLVDAVEDPRFTRGLGAALGAGATFGAGPRLRAAPVGAPFALPPRARVLGAEQSNTSIVYGEEAILKLYRRLAPGEQPDVELGRFLTTRARFPHTPALRATLTFEDGGAPVVAGMLQRFVPGAVDLWSHTLAVSRPTFADGPRAAPADVVAEATRLGRVTRALHEALASDPADPELAPWPATAVDTARWGAAVRAMATQALDLCATRVAAGTLPPPVAALARDAVAGRAAALARIDGLAATVGGDGGMQIRHHGDYHLGQVLRAPDGELLIIDFEGEPARPLAERRARHTPLRDVSGMLRSYAYAAASLGAETEAPPARAAAWEGATRAAFLNGYFARGPRALFPRAAPARAALLALLETEKAFYEVVYELQHRPAWAWIPLGALAAPGR
jgi:trehalose synthase-fused probable maltokinase